MEPLHALTLELKAALEGEVLTDTLSRGLYATDASMYQMIPAVVVIPRHRADAVKTVRLAAQYHLPILPRGGGTSLSGQTIAQGAVVLDFSKHMNRLLELNVQERWARVEPGLVRDELNALLKPHGLHFAPDPATSSRANVGGMIANNAAGTRSICYGMTIDHTLELDLALSDGEVLNLGTLTEEQYEAKCRLSGREGEIYQGFRALIDEHRDEILARYPKVLRRSGGYPLDAFAGPMPWNMAKIVASSEGTLGTVLEAKIRLEPLPKVRGLCVAQFATMGEALRAVAPIVAHGPSAVELIDHVIVSMARGSLLTRDRMSFVQGDPVAMLFIEAQGDEAAPVRQQLAGIAQDLQGRGLGYAHPLMTTPAEVADVWLMRENGLGLMSTVKGDRKPTAFIEDAAVPLEVLPEYVESVVAICDRYEQPVSLYAHASVGLIHVRPMFDMHQRAEQEAMERMANEVFELVVQYGGSWSGEHGDGIVRGGFNKRFFGERLYGAFTRLKALFDPAGLMNPGKIIQTPPMTGNLRYPPGYRMLDEGPRMFHFRQFGGLRQAVEQCTGVGACRKTLTGTMCPSYIATRDEEHSTRGRANALRLAMTGQLGMTGLADLRVHEALELCLSCKGCVKECPNAVDMPKLKAEASHAWHEAHGSTLRERMVRDSALSARLAAGPWAPVVNAIQHSAPGRWALEALLGLDARRRLPAYASQTFSRWWRGRAHAGVASDAPVVALYCDTYLEYYEPYVGQAAVEVLEAAGFRVELAQAGDSQRPALSKGFLEAARRRGLRTMQALDRWASRGIPILVCEPSDASAFTDDLPDLIEDEALGRRVAGAVKLVDQFLAEELTAGRCRLPMEAGQPERTILVHAHCHHKALYGVSTLKVLLEQIPGAAVTMLDAGCCGMAGAFGYEKEHYELSRKVFADRLGPALEAAPLDAVVVASGFSCRHQIRDLTGRPAVHGIEVVAAALASAK